VVAQITLYLRVLLVNYSLAYGFVWKVLQLVAYI
jgi:hypothetical protein